MLYKKYDIIIVGAGVSGLYTALNLDSRLKILLISKKELTVCNSALAQGGVAAVMNNDSDNFNLHINDTLIAGGHENNRENLKILVEHGPENIEKLIEMGVDFDKNSDGSIALTLEGGHSRNRIAHHKDSTGYEIVTSLIKKVKTLKNADCFENAHLISLDRYNGNFLAEVTIKGDSPSTEYYTSNICIIATGGIGGIYNYTTNSSIATGDGIYFAHKLGAEIKKMNLIQFHPTAFAGKACLPGESAGNGFPEDVPEGGNKEVFLISEAVRGEGAYLLNCNMERFMEKYEPERKELSPRDVVSRCIIEEGKSTGSKNFYLNLSHKDSGFIKSRFPMIYQKLLEKGYDLTKEPVPIYPCQHYLMGGIAVTGTGATNIEGLYAAGEAAYTGVHGLNRLASNSLLEALVFPELIADDINNKLTDFPNQSFLRENDYIEINYSTPDNMMKTDKIKVLPVDSINKIKAEIRSIMQKSFFIAPDYGEIEKGLKLLEEIKKITESGEFKINPEFAELRSMAETASLILQHLTYTVRWGF